MARKLCKMVQNSVFGMEIREKSEKFFFSRAPLFLKRYIFFERGDKEKVNIREMCELKTEQLCCLLIFEIFSLRRVTAF